ncbi:MAG: protein translocase subunit SecD, partial [Nitrospinota bacterium]|nr:protein translocase subunit SecD [Nitrospinota bacterium]
MKGLSWRGAVIAAVVLVAAFFMVPPKERINLGLDLQGGIHLVLEVQAEKAVTAKIDRYFAELKDRLAAGDVRTRSLRREGRQVVVALHRDSDRVKFT